MTLNQAWGGLKKDRRESERFSGDIGGIKCALVTDVVPMYVGR